jgi:hypothetical protein
MEVSNEVLLERLNHIKDDISEIKNHLNKLNNQTFKNTAHRIKQSNTNRLIAGFVSIFGVTLVGILMKII